MKLTIQQLFFFLFTTICSAQTGYVSGTVFNQKKEPLTGATISYGNTGTVTDANGFYKLEIPANQKTVIKFSYLGYGSIVRNFRGKNNKTIKFSPKLKVQSQEVEAIVLKSYQAAQEGVLKLKAEKFKKIPGANAGLKTY